MKHDLKCWPEFFDPIHLRDKRFDIRKNDRNYQVGDLLFLNEFEPIDRSNPDRGGRYTGRTAMRVVTYMTDFMQQPGVVVLSLE